MTDTSTQKALRTLYALPNDPAQIAKQLVDAGITGVKRDPCHCPIANLIRTVIDDDWDVVVTRFTVHVMEKGVLGSTVRLPINLALRKFIMAVDCGEYPELTTTERPSDCSYVK